MPRTDCEQQLFDSMKFLMDSSNFSAETLLMPGMEAGDENFKFARQCEPDAYNIGEKSKQIA